MQCRVFTGIPGLYPPDAGNAHPQPPSRDHQDCFQTWPNVLWGQNHPPPPHLENQDSSLPQSFLPSPTLLCPGAISVSYESNSYTTLLYTKHKPASKGRVLDCYKSTYSTLPEILHPLSCPMSKSPDEIFLQPRIMGSTVSPSTTQTQGLKSCPTPRTSERDLVWK